MKKKYIAVRVKLMAVFYVSTENNILILLYPQKISYICTVKAVEFMQLNKLKEVLDSKGITQTWLAKKTW